MMKTLLAFSFFCISAQTLSAQNAYSGSPAVIHLKATSSAALNEYINKNYASDTARVRAIYLWITNNVSYDVARLKAMDSEPAGPPQQVADVINSKMAVCQGYADLFVELCTGSGVEATVVPGYTKNRGVISAIPHAWAAAKLQGTWYLFDPTWGAGYVLGDRFVKSSNDKFYKLAPKEMIADHMPFDLMYQFMSATISNQEFIDGRIEGNKANTSFHYDDTLRQYNALSATEKWRSELRRLEAAGVRNDLLAKRQNFLKKSLQATHSRDVFMEGGDAFQKANQLYKAYMEAKRTAFSSIDDSNLRQMVDSIGYYTKKSRALLMEAIPKTEEQRQAKTNNGLNIERFGTYFKRETEFVEKFLAADKAGRQQLFGRR